MSEPEHDWSQPAAMAIPKEGYFEFQQGNYGPVFPQTPANYGFTVIAKIKPGSESAFYEYAKTIEASTASHAFGYPGVLLNVGVTPTSQFRSSFPSFSQPVENVRGTGTAYSRAFTIVVNYLIGRSELPPL